MKNVVKKALNRGLKVVRRIINLATTEWVDEHSLTWVNNAVKIKLLPEPDLRKPYPLDWNVQEIFY